MALVARILGLSQLSFPIKGIAGAHTATCGKLLRCREEAAHHTMSPSEPEEEVGVGQRPQTLGPRFLSDCGYFPKV